jgi:protein tyrosine phosphatase (PTP) superfamily phosphohydrolase (DUF442 family)
MQYQQSFRRRATILCGTACVAIVSAFAGSENPNLPNFYKVDDQVYRGAQPTDQGFKDLAKLGVKTVIDLRQIGEHSQPQEEAVVTGLGMRYVSIPMKGMSTPNDKQVADVMALFNDRTSGPVFVHCKRGADRTGMVVAVYRISHDHWDNSKALSEAKSDGMSIFQTAIKHYVSNFKAGVIEASAPSTVAALGAAQ